MREPMTNEIAVMDSATARAITDRIKVGVEAVWELIKQAYTERAWSALGYSSWDDYCTREFGTSRLRLPREERAEVVASLRDSGMSVRAIASATGDSYGTVRNALAGEQNCSPATVDEDEDELADNLIEAEAEAEADCDGKCATDECVCPEPESPREPAPVIGLDGKRYPQPRPTPAEPAMARRKPLVDAARDIGLDLSKLTRRIQGFGADDRLARNKSEVAPHLRHHLAEAIKVCQDLNHQLNQEA